MKNTGKHVITFLRLLITAAILPIATPCRVNITDIENVQDRFKDFTKVHNAKVVNLWISGLNWSDSSNETREVFDPNWWSWATKDTTTLLEIAIDYKVLSMGLLSIAVKDLSLNIVSYPPGCFEMLDFRQQRRIVMVEILHFTEDRDINKDGDDQLCRSVYSHRSVVNDHVVGVGKTCCTRKQLRMRLYDDCNGKHAVQEIDAFTRQSTAVFIIGTLLPFMFIPLALAWWELHPISAGEGFAKYLTNKLTKYDHFTLRGGGRLDRETLIIKEANLEPYNSCVSLTELLDINMRVSTTKIKLTFIFLLQYIPIVSWLLCYGRMKETLRKLDTTERILFNLRNNPLSWLFTDRSCSPFCIALVLVVLNFLQIVLLIVWWLMEKQTIRLKFAGLLRTIVGRVKQNEKDTCFYKIVQKTFTAFFICLMAWSYICIYSLFHSIMYTIGGLIVSIDIVSPWLTGGLLVLYYIQRSYGGMIDTYTKIKRLVFEVCRSTKVYKAWYICTRDVSSVDMEKRLIQEPHPKKTISFKPEKCEGPVLFVFPQKENEVMKIMISKEMLRQVCQRVEPIKASIRKAIVKQFFTILFLFLVVFTTAVFRLHTATGEVSALITSMATLLTALIPQLADMMATDAESGLRDDILKFNIQKLLSIHRPKFDVIETMNTPAGLLQDDPIRATNVIELHTQVNTEEDDFDGLHDDLPTLTGGNAHRLLENLMHAVTSNHPRQRHGSNHSNRTLASVPESSASELLGHYQTVLNYAESTDGTVCHKSHRQRTSPEDSPRTTKQNKRLKSAEMTILHDAESVPSQIPELAVKAETCV
ncbi:uncharacterized protein LOC135488795 [Lineus longissimus]|uniref:uncharacterized protein LOC135488795 n=1 Tax=Lineus longissimus TaxID=88925 RepID=UPI00315D0E94